MTPITRSHRRRLQAQKISRLRPRKMEDSTPSQTSREIPYNTRSSPAKKAASGKEKAKVSFSWDDQKRSLFLQLCAEEHSLGHRSGSTLKKEAFKTVAAEISRTFDVECTVAKCQNYWAQMKILWSSTVTLRSATGLGVDSVNACIEADDQWWEQAAQYKPELAKLKGKNLREIIHYGDILFKTVTATGEHVVYPSTAAGPNILPSLTRRLDLNFGHVPDDMRSGIPEQSGRFSPPFQLTPGSKSSSGRKRKSFEEEISNPRGKKSMVGTRVLSALEHTINAKLERELERERDRDRDREREVEREREREQEREVERERERERERDVEREKERENKPPSMDLCWPHLIEVFQENKQLSTYGATMLGNNERQRTIFLGWTSLEQKIEWLNFMEKSGYK